MRHETILVGDKRVLDAIGITVEEILAAATSDDYIGFCVACGAEHFGVEPDARGYPCQDCGECKVYGAEEILIDVC